MFDRIKALFESAETSDNQEIVTRDELQLAAAALLVEAASVDGDFDTLERQSIHTIMETHFNLSVGETKTLVELAELAVEKSGQLLGSPEWLRNDTTTVIVLK